MDEVGAGLSGGGGGGDPACEVPAFARQCTAARTAEEMKVITVGVERASWPKRD